MNAKAKQYPIKHHFVPVFYQKRFASEDGSLLVLNKEQGNIRNTAPAAIFYVRNLHTLEAKGKKYFELEKFHSKMESGVAQLLTEFDKVDDKDDISKIFSFPETQKAIKVFIAFMFWRNPAQTKLAEKYGENLVALYDKAPKEIKMMMDDRKTIKYLQKNLHRKKDCKKIIQYFVLPLLTFKIEEKVDLVGVNIVPKTAKTRIVTCSNPVVCRGSMEELFNYRNFVFPLDSRVVLGGSDNNNLDKYPIKKLNLEIANNSEKYIVSSDRSTLENLMGSLK